MTARASARRRRLARLRCTASPTLREAVKPMRQPSGRTSLSRSSPGARAIWTTNAGRTALRPRATLRKSRRFLSRRSRRSPEPAVWLRHSAACGPWPGGRESRAGRPQWPSAPGSRGAFCARAGSAGTFFSRSDPRYSAKRQDMPASERRPRRTHRVSRGASQTTRNGGTRRRRSECRPALRPRASAGMTDAPTTRSIEAP